MPYKIILFDLDGTLIDPKVGITKSVQYALKKFGIKADTANLLPFIGPPLNKSFQKYYGFSEEQSMEAVMYYREYLLPKGIQESTIYPQIIPLLKKLQKANKELFVVTSKPTFIAEEAIKWHHINTFFAKIVGCKDDLSNADKTNLIKQALELRPEEKKENFVMIGDRDFDILGAKANDIDTIGVLYGFGGIEEISNAQPTHIAKSVEDLKNICRILL